MLDHFAALPWAYRKSLRALACVSCLVLGASHASALPQVEVGPAPGVLLVQGAKPAAPPGSGQEGRGEAAELADLNEVLEATRTRLEELFRASAALAERREEFEALSQDNERMEAELEQADAREAELQRALAHAQYGFARAK